MTGQPASCGDLLDLLEQQDRIATELAELARTQAAMIERGETESLLSLLQRRQTLIDELISGQSAVSSLAGTARLEPDDDARARISELLDRIGATLSGVMQADETDQRRLRDRCTKIAQEISTTDTAKTARSAYGVRAGAGRPSPARFTDRTG